jgi:kynureninase
MTLISTRSEVIRAFRKYWNRSSKKKREGGEGDFREPNVIRAAPAPLYNTFHEVWRFARILAEHR